MRLSFNVLSRGLVSMPLQTATERMGLGLDVSYFYFHRVSKCKHS